MHGAVYVLATAHHQVAGHSIVSLGTSASLTLGIAVLTLFVAGATLKISYRAFQSQKKMKSYKRVQVAFCLISDTPKAPFERTSVVLSVLSKNARRFNSRCTSKKF